MNRDYPYVFINLCSIKRNDAGVRRPVNIELASVTIVYETYCSMEIEQKNKCSGPFLIRVNMDGAYEQILKEIRITRKAIIIMREASENFVTKNGALGKLTLTG